MRDRVHLYTISWNEERMLPFFFRHYDDIVDRFIVYDDGSTDRTLTMLAAHPRVEIRRFERTSPDSFAASARYLHNTVWEESRKTAEWVIITAIDEHLFVADFEGYLMRCRDEGTTLIPALGYQMVSLDFPQDSERLCDTRTWGAPFNLMSKLSIFNPRAVTSTKYRSGRHRAAPTGTIVYPPVDEMLLLHYKYLGMDYLTHRNRELADRLGPTDIKNKVGYQYRWEDDRVRAELSAFQAAAVNVRDPSLRYPATPWWREEIKTMPEAGVSRL